MARSGKFSIILSWYNSIGGIETWNFTAQKSYGYDINNVVNAKRDVFNDWDNDFSNGIIENDTLSIDANQKLIVRSQNLTLQQIEAIATIKLSPQVYDADQQLGVLIDRSSFAYRTDNDKRHSIEFFITYPNLIIPTA